MKKNRVIMISFLTFSLNAMQENKTWEGMIHGTNVVVKRACIIETKCNDTYPTNMVVLGENQQRILQGNHEFDWQVGNLRFLKDDERCIYVRYHKDDSASDEEHYTTVKDYAGKKMEERALSRKMSCDVLTVAEPIITISSTSEKNINALRYYTEIENEYNKSLYMKEELKGKPAIKAALEDLEKCYTTILFEGLERLTEQNVKFKKIAISTLSTECAGCLREQGAESAVKALIEFLQEHNNQYSVIEFYVKKVSEFEVFKKLLEEYVQPYLSPRVVRKKSTK